MVVNRGLGLAREPAEVNADVLDTLLNADGMRAAAAEVRAEIERMPAPVRIVPKLVELAG